MALRSAHIAPTPFWNPFGESPTLCLTQYLPPGRNADLLLLDCGDIRNILFTVYSGSNASNGPATFKKCKLDFTCCEKDAETIARNVIILSSIMENTKSTHLLALWKLYYHVFIDRDTLTILQTQANKLLRYQASLTEWEKSPYRSLIRFCDSTTFAKVARIWRLYAVGWFDCPKFIEIQESVKCQWDEAQRVHQQKEMQSGCPLDCITSSAPLHLEGRSHTQRDYNNFWKSGTCLEGKDVSLVLSIANPMFLSCQAKILHNNTDPLRGFHLSVGHVKLSEDSPIKIYDEISDSEQGLCHGMRVAFAQFVAWCSAFRASMSRVVVRYVNSDAAVLGHVLQHYRSRNNARRAHWYRSGWGFTTLILDSRDYSKAGRAPMCYDVISTWNIADRLGSWNTIAAGAPLLKPDQTSSLLMGLRQPPSTAQSMPSTTRETLRGDVTAMALLMGLDVLQIRCDSTATWHGDVLDLWCPKRTLVWKPIVFSEVYYVAEELAGFVCNFFRSIFHDQVGTSQDSEHSSCSSNGSTSALDNNQAYTRPSLGLILQHMKKTCVVDWELFIRSLLGMLQEENVLDTGHIHFSSLLVQLYILGLYSHDDLLINHSNRRPAIFRNWNEIPDLVCITLVVPKSALAIFNDYRAEDLAPLCQLEIFPSSESRQATYTDLQIGYGSLTTSGPPNSNRYQVHVEEDPAGQVGNSPLIVSAVVSAASFYAFGKPRCRILFRLMPTAVNAINFRSILDFELKIHDSFVGRKDVFITRFRPNLGGHMAAYQSPTQTPTNSKPPLGLHVRGLADLTDPTITIHPQFDRDMSKIVSLRVKYEDNSLREMHLLQRNDIVLETKSPYELQFRGCNMASIRVALTLPLAHPPKRLSRTHSSLEYTGSVLGSGQIAIRSDSIFPIRTTDWLDIQLGHLHYVMPDMLPSLDLADSETSYRWLKDLTKIESTMSAAELCEFNAAHGYSEKPGRVIIKENVESMFAHLIDVPSSGTYTCFIFWAPSPRGNSEFALIFVDRLRLDVANQTVFIDAACIPIYDSIYAQVLGALMDPSILKTMKMVDIKPSKVGASFWKHRLPAYAERCRAWKHKPKCEYKDRARTLSLLNETKKFMCGCGFGVFPEGYLGNWKQFKNISRLAIRVAIPIISHQPSVSFDDAFGSA